MAASFLHAGGKGEPMLPVVFPARSTGIGIANRQARRRRARTGAQIFPRQSSGRGAPRSRRRRGCGARRALRARGCGPVHSPLRAGGGGWRRQADRGGRRRRRPRLGGKPLEGLAGGSARRAVAGLAGGRDTFVNADPGEALSTSCCHAVRWRWRSERTRCPASCIPSFCKHQITPKTSRYTRCSMSMFPNASINGRIRSSGQLGRWWYSISPWRNNECVRRFTVFAFNQRS